MTQEELDIYQNKQIELGECIWRMWCDVREIDRLNKAGIRIPAMDKVRLPTIVEKLQEIIDRNPLETE